MFTDNKILILGFARSGYEAAKFLAKRNNEICESVLSSSKYINYPLLEKHSTNENIDALKDELYS